MSKNLSNSRFDDADSACYNELADSVNVQKRKDPKRNSKNKTKYMENETTRRSMFSKRGETMILMVNDVFNLRFALTSD